MKYRPYALLALLFCLLWSCKPEEVIEDCSYKLPVHLESFKIPDSISGIYNLATSINDSLYIYNYLLEKSYRLRNDSLLDLTNFNKKWLKESNEVELVANYYYQKGLRNSRSEVKDSSYYWFKDKVFDILAGTCISTNVQMESLGKLLHFMDTKSIDNDSIFKYGSILEEYFVKEKSDSLESALYSLLFKQNSFKGNYSLARNYAKLNIQVLAKDSIVKSLEYAYALSDFANLQYNTIKYIKGIKLYKRAINFIIKFPEHKNKMPYFYSNLILQLQNELEFEEADYYLKELKQFDYIPKYKVDYYYREGIGNLNRSLFSKAIESLDQAINFSVNKKAWVTKGKLFDMNNLYCKSLLGDHKIREAEKLINVLDTFDLNLENVENENIWNLKINGARLFLEKGLQFGGSGYYKKGMQVIDKLESLFYQQLVGTEDQDRLNATYFISQLTLLRIEYLYLYYKNTDDHEFIKQAILYFEKNNNAILYRDKIASKLQDSLISTDQSKLRSLKIDIQKLLIEVNEKNNSEDTKRLNTLYKLEKNISNNTELELNEFVSKAFTQEDLALLTNKCKSSDQSIMIFYEGINYLYVITFSINKFDFYKINMPYNELQKVRNFLVDHSTDIEKLYCELVNISELLTIPFIHDIETKNLTILPTGKLNNFPFEAFLYKSDFNFEGEEIPYLIDKYNVNYAFGLKQILEQNTKLEANASLLAYSYSSKKTIQSQDIDNELIYAYKEVKFLEKNWITPKSIFRYGKKSTKHHFIRNYKDFNIVHLALHGTSGKGYLDSRILFRGENEILHPYELMEKNLKSRLIFLSACEGGLGFSNSSESNYSMARSFASTGAKNIISSIWSLDDKSTLTIVSSFYHHLGKSLNLSYSLSESKRNFLENNKKHQHPYHWAGLILYLN